MQEWRNWQTRRLQVPVVARSCGFKSHLLHSFLFQVYIKASQSLDFARLLLFSIFRHVSDYSKNLPPFCPSLFLDKKASLYIVKIIFLRQTGTCRSFFLIILLSLQAFLCDKSIVLSGNADVIPFCLICCFDGIAHIHQISFLQERPFFYCWVFFSRP